MNSKTRHQETFESYARKELMQHEKEMRALRKIRESCLNKNNDVIRTPIEFVRSAYFDEDELTFYNSCKLIKELDEMERAVFDDLENEFIRFFHKFIRAMYGPCIEEIEEAKLKSVFKEFYTSKPKNEKQITRNANKKKEQEILRRKEYEKRVVEAEKERIKLENLQKSLRKQKKQSQKGKA
jgi:hypothetical protein